MLEIMSNTIRLDSTQPSTFGSLFRFVLKWAKHKLQYTCSPIPAQIRMDWQSRYNCSYLDFMSKGRWNDTWMFTNIYPSSIHLTNGPYPSHVSPAYHNELLLQGRYGHVDNALSAVRWRTRQKQRAQILIVILVTSETGFGLLSSGLWLIEITPYVIFLFFVAVFKLRITFINQTIPYFKM